MDAIAWENKVLKRLKVVKKEKWLNQGIWGDVITRRRPLGFKESEETKEKKRLALKGKPSPQKRCKKIRKNEKTYERFC